MANAKPKWQQEAEKAAIPEAATFPDLVDFEATDEETGEVYTFAQLVEKKIELDALLKDGELTKKWIGDQLLLALAMAEQDKVKVREDGAYLKVGNGRGPGGISPTKLLEAGVSVEQITSATYEGMPYSFAQIVIPKEGK